MDFDKMAITLTDSQRNLLLKYEADFADQSLFRQIALALKNGKAYEVYFDENELVDLVDQVSDFADIEDDEGDQIQLEHLCDCLAEYYDDMQEEDDDDYSEFSSNTGSVCILKVSLLNSEVWRKIAIREGCTLHDLHNFIFDAFDRYDDHMYSFYVPHSRKKFNPRTIRNYSDEFIHPYACEEQEMFGSETQDASTAPIESLDLIDKQKFYYLFDFGDMWWHEITVEITDEPADDEKYPRILERNGKSPDQYPDYDEDGEYDYDEEEDY